MKSLISYVARWRWILWDLVALQGALAVVLWMRLRPADSAAAVPATLLDYVVPAGWLSAGWLLILAAKNASGGFPSVAINN